MPVLPHGGTVEIDQQPLVGVAVERHGAFDAFHQIFKFGADESVAGVGRVHVQPSASLLRNRTFD